MLEFNHFFAGSNTCRGFYGVFDSVFDLSRLNRLFILKGGPGVGKSSLMKRAAQYAEGLGLTVDRCHCSSDPESLDGIIIRSIGVALMDGTSPHSTDPVLPAAADEIINLGTGLDEEKLKVRRKALEALGFEIKKQFNASNLFSAAAESIRTATGVNAEAHGSGEAESSFDAGEVFSLCSKKKNAPGNARHVFLSALTPEGIVSFLPDTGDAIPCGELKDTAFRAMSQGIDCVLCHDPINADRLEYVLLDGRILLKAKDFDADARLCGIYGELIDISVSHLKNAKRLHSELEAPYIEAMDFSVCDAAFERIARFIEKQTALMPSL